MYIRTYLRFKANYPIPEPGQSGAGPVASALVAGLRTKGFATSAPEDQEYAHVVRCASGPRTYEIMVAFDFVDGHTWEVSCPPRLGFFSRVLGQREDRELSALTQAIHDTMRSDAQVQEMCWYPAYGDKSNATPTPIQVA